jgi:2-keto-4-pentenoate hydratase/2-oxohepta-3-ene-1,7-dioic acid hydratase in catechol pathway
MRYATFSTSSDPNPRLGVINGDQIADVREFKTLLDLIHAGPAAGTRVTPGTTHAMRDVRLHAPIPRPSKNVFCLGRNYAEHVREGAKARGQEFKLPTHPVFFTKAPTSVIGPNDNIEWDRGLTQQVDWEAELGVIIGIGGKNIARADALKHVFGYTVINDVSARDLQTAHGQFFKGKTLDTFCPIGPVVVTADEFGDPQNKRVKLRVNGVEKQNGHTSDMIFPVDVTIESLSRGCTIEPGDIISTGTPDGVGMGRTPQEWLQVGDVVETEVEGIGILRNPVVAA